MKLRLLPWCALLAAAAAAVDAISFPPVQVASTASANELFAAAQLRDYLGNMSDTPVCLESGGHSPGTPVIAVGYDAAIALGVDAAALGNLKNDSYVISNRESGIPAGSYIITGGKASQRGAGFAVYDFLRELGCQFLAFDYTMEEECPTPPAALPSIDRTYHPLYEYRDNNEWAAATHPRWAGKLGYNGPSAHGETQSVDSVAYAGGFVHTSYALLGGAKSATKNGPPPDLFNSHREWFWPRADKDINTYGQLCWSNASLLEYLTGQARKTLQAHPDANIISISQNDNKNYCKDPEEMKIITEEGTPGGALFRAINTIATNLKSEFPNIGFDTLAYQWSRPAPKITKPKENVIIRLCDIECNFGAPLTDPSNAPFQKDMDAWAKISNRTYIWNYVTSFSSYIQPFPNWYVLGPNIKYFAKHGVRGIFEEGSYATSGGDMDALKDYVMGRMLWNTTLDPDTLIEEFLSGYFGKAAPFIKTYMDTMHESVVAKRYYMRESVPTNAPFLTPKAVLTSAQAFANASAAVASGSPLQKGRVDVAKISVYFVVLDRWDEMKLYAKVSGTPWPLEQTKEASWEEFTRMWKLLGITSEREGSCDYDCFCKQVFKVDPPKSCK